MTSAELDVLVQILDHQADAQSDVHGGFNVLICL